MLKIIKFGRFRDTNYSNALLPMLSDFGISERDISNCLSDYSNKEIDTIYCKSINDPSVRSLLERDKDRVFLFTGGGILSNETLSIPDAKFFHIHPGIVPEVRGADCFFWSWLIRGKPGYSVFYMNAGIDLGDVLYKREYNPEFPYGRLKLLKSRQIKDLILTYYDPCLRIITFIEMLKDLSALDFDKFSLRALPTMPQKEEDGRTYFFMHSLLMDQVIEMIVNRPRND